MLNLTYTISVCTSQPKMHYRSGCGGPWKMKISSRITLSSIVKNKNKINQGLANQAIFNRESYKHKKRTQNKLGNCMMKYCIDQ